MADTNKLSRRHVLLGRLQTHHIASAVVSVLPSHQERVARQISSMPGVEIHHEGTSKLILVLEGSEAGVIGSKLIEIAGLEGVLAANLVFEHVDQAVEPGEFT